MLSLVSLMSTSLNHVYGHHGGPDVNEGLVCMIESCATDAHEDSDAPDD